AAPTTATAAEHTRVSEGWRAFAVKVLADGKRFPADAARGLVAEGGGRAGGGDAVPARRGRAPVDERGRAAALGRRAPLRRAPRGVSIPHGAARSVAAPAERDHAGGRDGARRGAGRPVRLDV